MPCYEQSTWPVLSQLLSNLLTFLLGSALVHHVHVRALALFFGWTSPGGSLLFLLCNCGNWGSERPNDLPRVAARQHWSQLWSSSLALWASYLASPRSGSCVPPVLSQLPGKLQWESVIQGPCLPLVISLEPRCVTIIFPCWHYPAKVACRGLRASSLCSTCKLPERPQTQALEPRAGISGPGKPQAWALPASPYMLFIPHTCSRTQMLSAMEFPAWTEGKECILRPTRARKIIQPGPIPRARRPSCRPDQSPHPVTSDQPPGPAALPLSRTHPLGAGCTLARRKGQGVKGPREGMRERRPSPSPRPHRLIPGTTVLPPKPFGGRRSAHSTPAMDNGELKQLRR